MTKFKGKILFRRYVLHHLGAYYMIIACMFFAAVGGFAKVLSEQMSSIEVVFFRNAVGLAIVLYAIYKRPPTQRDRKSVV